MSGVVKSEPADVLKKRDVPHLVAGDDIFQHDRIEYRRQVLVATLFVVAELLERGEPAIAEVLRKKFPGPPGGCRPKLEKLRHAERENRNLDVSARKQRGEV